MKNLTQKLYGFPLILGLLFPVLFLVTLSFSVYFNHCNFFYVYISDTGRVPPEQCVFTLGLQIISWIYLSTVYIRYKQVNEYYTWKYGYGSKSNEASIWAALVSVLGIAFGFNISVSSFQISNLKLVHLVGAFVAFLFGSIWCCLNAYLTFKLLPEFASYAVGCLRLFLGILGILLYLICQACGPVSAKLYKDERGSHADTLLMTSNDPGYVLRSIAVTSEWLMLCSFSLYMLTLVPEFAKLSYDGPLILLDNKLDVESIISQQEKVDVKVNDKGYFSKPNSSENSIEKNSKLSSAELAHQTRNLNNNVYGSRTHYGPHAVQGGPMMILRASVSASVLHLMRRMARQPHLLGITKQFVLRPIDHDNEPQKNDSPTNDYPIENGDVSPEETISSLFATNSDEHLTNIPNFMGTENSNMNNAGNHRCKLL